MLTSEKAGKNTAFGTQLVLLAGEWQKQGLKQLGTHFFNVFSVNCSLSLYCIWVWIQKGAFIHVIFFLHSNDHNKGRNRKQYLFHVNPRMMGFPGGSVVRSPPSSAGDVGLMLGWEDPLEEGTATHSSILAWRIPWAEGPGGLQSMGSQSEKKWKLLSLVQLFETPWTIVGGIFQARILAWVAYPFSRGSSQHRNRTGLCCIAGRFFTKELNTAYWLSNNNKSSCTRNTMEKKIFDKNCFLIV